MIAIALLILSSVTVYPETHGLCVCWTNTKDTFSVTQVGVFVPREETPLFIENVVAPTTPGRRCAAYITLKNLDVGTYLLGVRHYTTYGNASDWAMSERFEITNEPVKYAISGGDANGDGVIDIGDAVQILEYLYGSGEEPKPCQ